MKLFWATLLFFSSNCFASMKSLGGSMHGKKMAVEYSVLNSGRHILITKEKTGMKGNKAKFEELSVTELNIKTGESLSSFNGFQCKTNRNEFCYGVVHKKNASEKNPFKPERAWVVDQKSLKLLPVEDLKNVTCMWSPEGESKYPFK